ncbi:HNH endonuclease [Methylobacterium phyllosphaerae]
MPPKPRRLGKLQPKLKPAEHRTVLPRPKVPDSFYGSPEWRALRAAVLAERGPRCEKCGAEGRRLTLDHKHELRDGGAPLDRSNLMLMCSPCHVAKTAQARARRHGLA